MPHSCSNIYTVHEFSENVSIHSQSLLLLLLRTLDVHFLTTKSSSFAGKQGQTKPSQAATSISFLKSRAMQHSFARVFHQFSSWLRNWYLLSHSRSQSRTEMFTQFPRNICSFILLIWATFAEGLTVVLSNDAIGLTYIISWSLWAR